MPLGLIRVRIESVDGDIEDTGAESLLDEPGHQVQVRGQCGLPATECSNHRIRLRRIGAFLVRLHDFLELIERRVGLHLPAANEREQVVVGAAAVGLRQPLQSASVAPLGVFCPGPIRVRREPAGSG